MKIILSFILLVSSFYSQAQTKTKDTITRRAKIKFEQKANIVIFKPETPPLIPIAGAPKPNYTYLWEMGDGHYSREAEPKHVYKSKGEYTARIAVTNNYDNGKPPSTRPKKIVVNEMSSEIYKDIASIELQNGLNIQKNCDPIPDQEMVVALSYQNLENYVANGKLYFFYNEKQFKNNNFELLEFRTHNNEREIKENTLACNLDIDESYRYLASENSFVENKKYKTTTTEEDLDATLLEANKTFKNVTILEFDNAESKETRNVFFTFKTTPEMIKDTSATVTMRSIFVPNRSYKNHKIKNLEMQIVTSHDPNKMSSNATSMNYRTVRFKNINFKTQFQNNGEGPARAIRLETDSPDMFDKKTLKIVDSYPKCPICPKGETPKTSCLDTIIKQKQIHFTFKNIYIPGSNQKNIKEIDSTKGFVKYTMKLNKNFHKQTTRSKTAIFFDKNEPVITNNAKTGFKMGISIGARTGLNIYPKLENVKSYFLGATISPFKSYKMYWQSELYFNNLQNNFETKTEFIQEQLQTPYNPGNGQIIDVANTQTITSISKKRNSLEVVPVSLRYNLNNFIGVGVGPQFSLTINEIENIDINKKFYSIPNNTSTPPRPEIELFAIEKKDNFENKIDAFKQIQTNLFADITFGFARIGPSLGARYLLNTKSSDLSHIQFYGIWKF
jgi:PKD domain